jgi:hypothetical protein
MLLSWYQEWAVNVIPPSVVPTPVTTKNASVEPIPVTTKNVIATDFGRPLNALQEGIPPLQDSFAQIQREESKDEGSPASSTTGTVSTAVAIVTIDADTLSGAVMCSLNLCRHKRLILHFLQKPKSFPAKPNIEPSWWRVLRRNSERKEMCGVKRHLLRLLKRKAHPLS